MKQQDTYYRALRDLRKQTSENRDCETVCRAFSAASGDEDRMTVRRAFCTVDEEWINAIEEGLTFVEKALKEERQFIQSNGEIVVIEKVKHVSTESVVHLAQHSNLITREQKDDEIVPDGLFTVERLNEYAVYENRFLYMLLRYLQDFITLRYTSIMSLTNRYDGIMTIDRSFSSRGRTLDYKLSLHDMNEEDPYLRDHNPCSDILRRIDLILKAVLAFLNHPIMECCAKVAMLRPPITKTNVLKMDNNFKGAVRLYEYITSYEGDGYTVEHRETTISPFRDELGAGLSEAGLLSSFLMYEYGLGLTQDFRLAYEQEEERRSREELERRKEQLVRLKRRLEKSEIDPAEYILELEKQNKLLEKQASRVASLEEKIGELELKIVGLNDEITSYKKQIAALESEREAIITRYEEKIALIISENEHETAELKKAHTEEIEQLKAECEQRLQSLTDSYEEKLAKEAEARRQVELASKQKIEALETAHKQELDNVREQAAAEKLALEEKLTKQKQEADETEALLKQTISQEKDRSTELEQQYRNEEKLRLVSQAELMNIRREQGLIGEDETFTDEQSFDEIEKQYKAFRQFYREQWGESKKEIRKSILNPVISVFVKDLTAKKSTIQGSNEQESTAIENVLSVHPEESDCQVVITDEAPTMSHEQNSGDIQNET